MPPTGSFETWPFNPFSVNENLKDNDQDPNVNFYQTQISSLDTSYYIQNEAKDSFSFCVLYLNIRSMSKNFESFREFLDSFLDSHSVLFVYQKHGASLTKLKIQISKYLAA